MHDDWHFHDFAINEDGALIFTKSNAWRCRRTTRPCSSAWIRTTSASGTGDRRDDDKVRIGTKRDDGLATHHSGLNWH